MAALMRQATAREGANPQVQVPPNEQITRSSTGWTGALPLVQLHTRQSMYATLFTSPPNSHLLQLHFNLTDATHWTTHYNGFSYEEFYEFIVDFFEVDATPDAQEASAKLLEWWNKYIYFSFFPAAVNTTPLERCSRGLQPPAQPNRHQYDGHRLRSYDNNVRLPAHLTRPRSFCNTPDVCLFHINITVCYESPIQLMNREIPTLPAQVQSLIPALPGGIGCDIGLVWFYHPRSHIQFGRPPINTYTVIYPLPQLPTVSTI